MAKRRTVTDRTRAHVVQPPDEETRERIRNGLDSLREFGDLVGGLVSESRTDEVREQNPRDDAQDDEQFLESGPDESVVWPEIADQIDVESYLETVGEIADLGHRLDTEDHPDADRFLAAQHYLQLLEDGADDFEEEYVLSAWETWVERAKKKAPEFSEQIEDFLL